MSEKHVVVHGATCKCKFSETPQTDKLKVLSQTKEFANDKDVSKKLIATDKEIGQTLEKNSFGKCKLQPTSSGNLPCQAVITKWNDVYEKVIFEENSGKILLMALLLQSLFFPGTVITGTGRIKNYAGSCPIHWLT